MKPTYFFILLSVCVLLSGCTTGSSNARSDYDFSSIDRVAVIDVEGDLVGEVAKNQLADYFVMELLRKGYAPIERARVQALLREQQFQASDITAKEGMARAGKILNVKTVLLINVPKFDDQISITARMVDLEDGSIFKRDEGTMWACLNCGYVFEGEEAPSACPACAHPQAHFEVLGENW